MFYGICFLMLEEEGRKEGRNINFYWHRLFLRAFSAGVVDVASVCGDGKRRRRSNDNSYSLGILSVIR